MSKRFLYGAIDITTLEALAVGTSESKIKEFIADKADERIKLFKVTTEFGKNYKVRLNIEDFSPNRENFNELTSAMQRLWQLIYMFEMDMAESNTEIHVFE